MKNSNGTIGNWTRDLPTCSAAPQQTVPPPTPSQWHKSGKSHQVGEVWGTYMVLLKTQNLLGCCTVKTAKQLPAFQRNVVPSKCRCLPVETVWRHWALQIFCVGSVSVSPQCHAQRYVNWHSLDLTAGKASSRAPYNFLPFLLRFFCISNTNYTECTRVCMIHNPHINRIYIYIYIYIYSIHDFGT